MKAEFDHQRATEIDAGRQPDPRLTQIERLQAENTKLRERLSAKNAELDALQRFRTEALSRLTAQHDEITALRQEAHTPASNVHTLR